MSKMKISSGGKHFSLRAIASTIVGESADSLLFFPIAFGGVVPVKELIVLIVTQACLKTAYEIIILPVTIRVVRLVRVCFSELLFFFLNQKLCLCPVQDDWVARYIGVARKPFLLL